MNKVKTNKCFGLILVFALGMFSMACGNSDSDIAATVDQQVAVAVRETIAVYPTLTPLPTYTLYPTLTSAPTFTPEPTLTIPPTYTPHSTGTPNPTYTPDPTYTPLPTATATETPEPTLIPQPVVAAPIPPPQANSDVRLQVLTKIEQTLTAINVYIGTIDPLRAETSGITIFPTDCQTFVNTHNSIANRLVITGPFSEPIVESAYNRYLVAVDTIISKLTVWTDLCRESLANGEATRFLGRQAISTIATDMIEPMAILNQAANDLRALESE